jgi:hypothetical protein
MNVAVEWLAFVLCIQDMPGLNIGPETYHPELGFSYAVLHSQLSHV